MTTEKPPRAIAYSPVTLCLLALVALALPLTAQADENIDFDPTELSLEELMNIDLEVTSVSKKSQRLKDTPAAIFVITQEDLRRGGAVSIAEALRLVPGLQVARLNGSTYAITSRGFNGQFANNLLVLIDGRSVYTPLFSGVFWDLQDLVLNDIDRIEVIRGPGAAIWGANATNGVINVITKPAAETLGGLVSIIAGTEERQNVSVRYGAALDDGAWRVWGKSLRRDSLKMTDGSDGRDSHGIDRFGFRVDRELSEGTSLTVSGGAFQGDIDYPQDLPDFASRPTTRTNFSDRSSGQHVLARFTRDLGDRGELTVQTYYDHHKRRNSLYEEARDTVDVEVEHHYQPAEDHDLIWGAGYRSTRSRVTMSALTQAGSETNHEDMVSLFAQDDIRLNDEMTLTLGSKVEHNSYTGWEFQPDARFAYRPNDREMFWASLSRAVRTPSALEHEGMVFAGALGDTPFPGFSTFLQFSGSESVDAENLTAAQIGYRIDVDESLSIDATAFVHTYDDLVGYELGTPTPLSATTVLQPAVADNKQEGQAVGVEVYADWRPTDDWQFQAAYSYIDLEIRSDGTSTASDEAEHGAPQDQVNLRAHHQINDQWDMSATLFYVDTVPASGASSYISGSARLGWQPDDSSEWNLGVHNLFHDGEVEWGNEFLTVTNEIETSFYLSYTRRF